MAIPENDKCLVELSGSFGQCASFLKEAAASKKQIVLRFHSDTDGICGALNVFRALKSVSPSSNIASFRAPYAVYDKDDSLSEIGSLKNLQDTVFVLIDHAANGESIDALALLKSYGIKIVIIDHHPFSENAKNLSDIFVSPFLFEGCGSSYTAGLLCYEIAKLIDENAADEKLAFYSLQSDKSRFAEKNFYKEAVAIDYLAICNSEKLEFYEMALSDAKLMEESFLESKRSIYDAARIASKSRETKLWGSFAIMTVRLEKALDGRKYPSKGLLLNELHGSEDANVKRALVSIGTARGSIAFRANDSALQMGFSANKLIQELKKEFPSDIIAGGGHDGAASLRVSEDSVALICEDAVKRISALFG